jgi:hypothetical protein
MLVQKIYFADEKQKHKKPNAMCVGHYYPQTNTDNVNET